MADKFNQFLDDLERVCQAYQVHLSSSPDGQLVVVSVDGLINDSWRSRFICAHANRFMDALFDLYKLHLVTMISTERDAQLGIDDWLVLPEAQRIPFDRASIVDSTDFVSGTTYHLWDDWKRHCDGA